MSRESMLKAGLQKVKALDAEVDRMRSKAHGNPWGNWGEELDNLVPRILEQASMLLTASRRAIEDEGALSSALALYRAADALVTAAKKIVSAEKRWEGGKGD